MGANMPIIGMNPTVNPALVTTPVADALVADTYRITGVAPYATDAPGVEVPLAYGRAESPTRKVVTSTVHRSADTGPQLHDHTFG